MATESRPLTPRPAMQSALQPVPRACPNELEAYLTVAGVANRLGPTRNILDFALDDLEARLVACLREDAAGAGDWV